MCSAAEATASPVPLGCSWIAVSTPSGSQSSSRRFGLSTTIDLAGAGLERRGHGPQDQRTAAERVQDLGQRGAHAGSFAGGDDDDGGRRHRSHRSIELAASRFDGESSNRPGHWVLVPGIRVRVLAPQSAFRPARMRTYVRATVHGGGTASVVPRARTMAEVLRHFGLRPAGGNHRLLRRWLDEWGIPYDHFTGTPSPCAASRSRSRTSSSGVDLPARPAQAAALRRGLKQRECELCGQGEEWRGRRMSLILDHINGIADDNRLENLQIVCPNCAATLDTHCGRANRRTVEVRPACDAGRPSARSARQRYCSRDCGQRWPTAGRPIPGAPAGGAAAVRAAARRGRGAGLVRRRTQVRRQRQRGAQVDARVRAGRGEPRAAPDVVEKRGCAGSGEVES